MRFIKKHAMKCLYIYSTLSKLFIFSKMATHGQYTKRQQVP